MRVGVDLCNTIADVNAEIKKVLGLPENYVFREYGLMEAGVKDAGGWFKRHPEVFAEALPLPGAVEALDLLVVRGADIYYVTSRPAWAREITERWLRKWGFPEGQLVMEADKARVCKSLGLALFFEDAPEQIERLRRTGANVVAVAQPYNRGVFRWELVLEKGGNFLDIFLYGAGMLPGLPQAVLLPLR
ncbi:MAG: 5' nucleotidase, NT5C type [Moorellaceae bacterium]